MSPQQKLPGANSVIWSLQHEYFSLLITWPLQQACFRLKYCWPSQHFPPAIRDVILNGNKDYKDWVDFYHEMVFGHDENLLSATADMGLNVITFGNGST